MTATHFATSEAKRSRMTGGALTEEALDSSRAILAGGMFDKGLEQFFTPPIAAQFIKDVIDLGGRGPVLDPTAGNGALLEPWAPAKRFGIEIDTDHTSVGAYQAIRGDLQQAYPMLKLLGVRFPRISANPPFGLPWRDGAGNAINSTVYTYRISHALLADDGVGAIIGGRDRFRRDVLALPEAAGIVALLDCDDLFADDGVQLPCVIAFFVKDSNRFNEGVQIDRAIARADLADEGLAREIRAAIHGSAGYIPDVNTISDLAVATSFKKVDGEMERRRIDAKVNRQAFDLMLAGGRVSSRPGPFARAALANAGDHRMVERLHRQPVSYFALNLPEWRAVNRYADEGLLTIDPALTAAVSEVTAEAEREIVPLYHVRPQQRLGFLEDLDSILCTVGDPDAGFVAGERYPLSTSTDVLLRKGVEIKPNKKGEPVKRDFEEEAKVLAINIGSRRFTEAKEDVEYILEHFDVPDPGDIATRFPEAVERQRRNLLDIQEQYGRGGFAWKKFQLEDLSRIAAKVEHGGGAMLMWEQGGGKTLGAAGFALAAVQNGAANQILFIVPQDLIPQYRDDIREKLGIEVEHIDSPRMAREVARKMKDGQDGWYVTHYEVLSLLGAKDERDPQTVFTRVTDNEDGTVTRRALEVDEFCPKCHATLHTGWQQNSPLVCDAKVRDDGKRRWAKRQRVPYKPRRCGYVHKTLKVPTAAHYLASAFADGVICIDEGTLIKGYNSQRSKAVRGLRARYRLLATGTPVSNYVNQVFWLLWWCLGDACLRFPYSYEGGVAKFESDFCVIRHFLNDGEKNPAKKGRRERRKIMPAITNISRFWRLIAASGVRRRKADFGEPLVPLTLKTVAVPMGEAQRALYEFWLNKSTFAGFFEWKHPDSPLVKAGLVERFAAGCGQLAKLERASTLPASDPDPDWPGLAGMKLSNWTPANHKTLELICEHVAAGEKVLVGSDLIETGRWLTSCLTEKGVKAAHIVEDRDGQASTVGPKKRAKAIGAFRHGDVSVLCTGIKAVRLGHNLDTASVVIINGLEFSYEDISQFLARVHRLSSKKPVTAYILLPEDSLAVKKWELLQQKEAAADLGLDGQLVDKPEEPIDMEKVLAELIEKGIDPNGETVPEDELAAAWRERPMVFDGAIYSGPIDVDISAGPVAAVASISDRHTYTRDDQLDLFDQIAA